MISDSEIAFFEKMRWVACWDMLGTLSLCFVSFFGWPISFLLLIDVLLRLTVFRLMLPSLDQGLVLDRVDCGLIEVIHYIV